MTVVVAPEVTVAVLLCVVCPVFETVIVYVPTGIQLVVNSPEVLVLPVTVVAMEPPLIVTVAPLTTAPLAVTTLAVIFPAVASWKLRVTVAPLVTFTALVRDR